MKLIILTLLEALGIKTYNNRLYRREVFDEIIPKIVSKGYAFQMEIILRAAHQGLKIEEVPIVFVERIFGESKFTSKEVKNYLRGVWNLMWQF